MNEQQKMRDLMRNMLHNRDIIIPALRGGVPARCNFCDAETPPHELHPEEAGDWVCDKCLKRWAEEDKEANQ